MANFYSGPIQRQGGYNVASAYSIDTGNIAETNVAQGQEGCPALPFQSRDGLQLLAAGYLWSVPTSPNFRLDAIRPLRANAIDAERQIASDGHSDFASLGELLIKKDTDIIIRQIQNMDVVARWVIKGAAGSAAGVTLSPSRKQILLSGPFLPGTLLVDASSGPVVSRFAETSSQAVFTKDGGWIIATTYAQPSISAWKLPARSM